MSLLLIVAESALFRAVVRWLNYRARWDGAGHWRPCSAQMTFRGHAPPWIFA